MLNRQRLLRAMSVFAMKLHLSLADLGAIRQPARAAIRVLT
jgi:hypothetical protein